MSLSPYPSVGCLPLCLCLHSLSRLFYSHCTFSTRSQYFVVIAADCFQGGDHINAETRSYYVTSFFPSNTLSTYLCSSHHCSFFFSIHSTVHGDITMPVFVSLSPLSFSVSTLPSTCSMWVYLGSISTSLFHPLCLSLSLQWQAMNI